MRRRLSQPNRINKAKSRKLEVPPKSRHSLVSDRPNHEAKPAKWFLPGFTLTHRWNHNYKLWDGLTQRNRAKTVARSHLPQDAPNITLRRILGGGDGTTPWTWGGTTNTPAGGSSLAVSGADPRQRRRGGCGHMWDTTISSRSAQAGGSVPALDSRWQCWRSRSLASCATSNRTYWGSAEANHAAAGSSEHRPQIQSASWARCQTAVHHVTARTRPWCQLPSKRSKQDQPSNHGLVLETARHRSKPGMPRVSAAHHRFQIVSIASLLRRRYTSSSTPNIAWSTSPSILHISMTRGVALPWCMFQRRCKNMAKTTADPS
jgi:hypothetical protein